ncbi:MAG: CoA pyrophosphatase [Thalassospira sp.]|uniref:CoA pyrophosphatase n=1 Tax=Thalassospira sp. TaxID=1912094 RepID=UPI000C504A9D|nr:CoA pyrophosphatase [Thalassospira sp.]MAZ35402.1 CoA pyrophosphatase [Thalassospira sp.]|tara:strand:- start:186 stop:821 length:636 start_codon:yes stop_codon:yes gene_type:complete
MTPAQIIAALNAPRGDILQRRGDHAVDYPGSKSRARAFSEGELIARPAAVLVPLVQRDEGLHVILTRRTDHLSDHAGQISFPGGRQEDHDNTLEETALRETEEEIGLARVHIELVGRLDDYYTVTGYQVTPVVGLITPPFDLAPDAHEVAEVFEVPLEFILEPRNQKLQTVTFEGAKRRYFAIPYREYYIWGATAGMLVNFSEVLKASAER